jgi:hypothetical protein
MTRNAAFPLLAVVSNGGQMRHTAVFARMTTLPLSGIIAS